MSATSVRLTVRLPSDLYERLQLVALGRSPGKTPEISTIVREALEQYLSPRRPMKARNVSDKLSDKGR
jgi:predicted DNA-binding protein